MAASQEETVNLLLMLQLKNGNPFHTQRISVVLLLLRVDQIEQILVLKSEMLCENGTWADGRGEDG